MLIRLNKKPTIYDKTAVSMKYTLKFRDFVL